MSVVPTIKSFRAMLECPVCGQTVPSDKGRVTFHLVRGIFTDRFRVCPGSEHRPTLCTEGKIAPARARIELCGPCCRGQHLLCDDDCGCSICKKLDLPH